MVWIILGIISIFLLFFYYNIKNAIWGGFTIGLILGLIVAIFLYFQGGGFDWYLIGKYTIVSTLIGFGAELLGKISDLLKKK